MRGEICKNHFAVKDLLSYPNGRICLKKDALPLSSIDETDLTKILTNTTSDSSVKITKSSESSDCPSCRGKQMEIKKLQLEFCIEKQKHQNITYSMETQIDNLKQKLKKYQNQSNFLKKTKDKLLEIIKKSIETNKNQDKIERLLEVFNLFGRIYSPYFKNIFCYSHDCYLLLTTVC